jgi:hypothetical protein
VIIIMENQKLLWLRQQAATKGKASKLLAMHTYAFDIRFLDSNLSLITPPATEENRPTIARLAALATANWSLYPGKTFMK